MERQRWLLGTWAIFSGYALLLVFFNVVDVYHRHFFATGGLVIIYNLARVAFIFYFLWLLYALGDRLLILVGGPQYQKTFTLNFALAGIFTGFGAWHILLFFLGFAGLYSKIIMAGLSLGVFLLSLRRLDDWLRVIHSNRSQLFLPGLIFFIIPLMAFIAIKGLYPAGGHDYYNHYFQFYRKVTEAGSIWPNEVWYHFYYSKGAGLFFLSMLLTDPLAPQLASTAMILAGAMIVFTLIHKNSVSRFLPWFGAALYITFLIYTPGPFENMRQGGWGDLEKLHEPAAVLLLAMMWLSTKLSEIENRRIWQTTLLLTTISVVILTPVMAIIGSCFLILMLFYYLMQKEKNAALWVFLSICSALGSYILLAIINYAITGVPEDQNLLRYWPIINLDKVKEWGVFVDLLMVHWAKTGLVANQVPLTSDILIKIYGYIRLDVWIILVLMTLLSILAALCTPRYRSALNKCLDKKSFYAFATFIGMMAVLSAVIGRDQNISFYRFTTFMYAPMLCFCLLLLSAILRNRITITLFVFTFLALNWVAIKKIDLSYYGRVYPTYDQTIGQYDPEMMPFVLKNSYRFVSGRYSIHDAYINQKGWPGRMPWGGIYPPIETVWKMLPPKTRIWSMHIHSYCMLPDCHVEGFISYRFSPHIDTVLYGNPQIAKQWLQKENMNYFFVSNSLQFTDPLPLSPLFSPDSIQNYLGIVWTDGDNTLLTWKEQAASPIDEAWLERYRDEVKKSLTVKSFPYDAIKKVLAIANHKKHMASAEIPWYRAGWS